MAMPDEKDKKAEEELAKLKAEETARLKAELEKEIRAEIDIENKKVLEQMKADLALNDTDKLRTILKDIPKEKFKAEKVYATYYPNGFLDIYNGVVIQFVFDGSEIEMYKPIVDYVKDKIEKVVALEVEKSQKTLAGTINNVIANINLE